MRPLPVKCLASTSSVTLNVHFVFAPSMLANVSVPDGTAVPSSPTSVWFDPPDGANPSVPVAPFRPRCQVMP